MALISIFDQGMRDTGEGSPITFGGFIVKVTLQLYNNFNSLFRVERQFRQRENVSTQVTEGRGEQ